MPAERVEGYTTNATKVRDGDDIKEMVYDAAVVAQLQAQSLVLGQILTALNGIRARLDAGIKVQNSTIAINI